MAVEINLAYYNMTTFTAAKSLIVPMHGQILTNRRKTGEISKNPISGPQRSKYIKREPW
jgi:hypothetical protein